MTVEEALSHPWFAAELSTGKQIPSAYHRSLYRSRHRETRDDITCVVGRVLAPKTQSQVDCRVKSVQSAERPLVSPLQHTIGQQGQDVKLSCQWKDLKAEDTVKWYESIFK